MGKWEIRVGNGIYCDFVGEKAWSWRIIQNLGELVSTVQYLGTFYVYYWNFTASFADFRLYFKPKD